MNPGSIVRCRNREWVLLPSDQPAAWFLRPLTGATDEVVAVHRQLTELVSYTLDGERVRSATFPLPSVDDLSDAAGAQLLWQAARLTLREGATPFRCLGRISIRPRIYQLVPLLMALRMAPVRLLIADDVGIGKTIEALLIVREMLERGEIKRICILCPPYLCEQWQKELAEKFNLDAVVIRSGTVGQLERRKVGQASIYKHYPVQVASIDFVKTDRNRHHFLLDCPDFVIVDEAHGSAVADNGRESQHQRHALVQEIAARSDQHLVMLTATPHSGVESAFRSLLSLLKPEFADFDTTSMNESQRIDLARHFVQRTRRDIESDWEGSHCFPTRETTDETYRLSPKYRDLFGKTYDFCCELVKSGGALGERHQRVRYWGALALLRCVMSSPAAALAALEARHDNVGESEDEADFRQFVFESSEDRTDDDQPAPPVQATEAMLADNERRRLRELAKLAEALHGSDGDTKLTECASLLVKLLMDGFNPIVWCRYVATAEYMAAGLSKRLERLVPGVRIVAVTGRMTDDERVAMIQEVEAHPRHVLVATDCLSEGVNLQQGFNAVLHYDLPWNPNRLEQREGRVDRYGQPSRTVRSIRFFSSNNPVDGVVLDVLLNKATEIHRTLGTHVPVPEESETVTQAVLSALFLRGRTANADQLLLDFGNASPDVASLHHRWERDAERERVNRTRFAQRALKPAEVRQELDRTDAVLGDPAAVREFVLAAAQRLGMNMVPEKRADVFRIPIGEAATASVPAAVRFALPSGKTGHWLVTFTSPNDSDTEYLGRNHRFVATLARFLMEEALTKAEKAVAARCGVIRTKAVSRLTTIALLRVRYLVNQPDRAPLLAEEVVVEGYTVTAKDVAWLDDGAALALLAEAKPDANVAMTEKRKLTADAIESWPSLSPQIQTRIDARASALERSHKRVRQAVSMKVRDLKVSPQFPPDLLGVLVMQPVV